MYPLTHHYIIFFSRPLHSKHLYRGRPMLINQSGVTELLIMRDPHYGRMCFKSVKTLRVLHC